MKTSVCGLDELGVAPKWSAIEVEDDTKQFFSVENLTSENCNLQRKGKPGEEKYSFNFGKNSLPVLDLKFKIHSPQKCEYVTMERDCNCFPIEFEKGQDYILVTARIGTKDYRKNIVTAKRFTIVFQQSKGEGRANFQIEFIKIDS